MSEQLYKNANPNAGTEGAAEEAANNDANAAGNDGNVYDADYKVEGEDNK